MDDTAPRLRLPRLERRRQLLETASQVFTSRGYHATSMDDIAEQGGVSKPVLYQHFASKLELYLALVEAACLRLEELVRQAVTSTTDNADRVEACVRSFFDFAADPASGATLVFEADRIGDDQVRKRIWDTLTRILDTIADVVSAETGLPTPQAQLVATALMGMADRNARYWMRTPSISRDRAAELSATIAWRGISGIPRSGGSH